MSNEITKLPPQNLEAERCYLGACMIETEYVMKKSVIRSEDFYRDAHKKIYAAMVDIYSQGEAVDIITVSEKLKGTNTIESVGGASYLAQLVYETPTAANCKTHEKIIMETAIKRRVISQLNESMRDIYTVDSEKVIHDIRMNLSNIVKHGSKEIIMMSEIMLESYSLIERRSEQTSISGITTGFRDIDILTDGWQPGEFIVLAGRPGMGKTALMRCAMTTAASKGVKCGEIHLEMGRTQLGNRAISSKSGISLNNLKRGMVHGKWEQVQHACSYNSDLHIALSFSSYTDREISQTIDSMVFDKECQMIGIDYLQLATSEDTGKNREQEVAAISRMIKLKANEHGIPIIALAQLNRKCEDRTDKRPMLSDLRESGAIEQDADIIAFIYQDEKYNENSPDKGIAEVIFRKGRQIELDTVKLQWDGFTTTFRDLDYHSTGSQGNQHAN